MVQQNLAMPAVCIKCGELFDMTYDLKKYFRDIEEMQLFSKKSKKLANLCWECRVY